jgi:hypothetical protein
VESVLKAAIKREDITTEDGLLRGLKNLCVLYGVVDFPKSKDPDDPNTKDYAVWLTNHPGQYIRACRCYAVDCLN